MENISVNKAVTTVSESGINHKSVVVKAQTAKLLDHVITAIGPERFYGSSKDTQVRSFCFFCHTFCRNLFVYLENWPCYSTKIGWLQGFNTQNMTNPTNVSAVKMEYG